MNPLDRVVIVLDETKDLVNIAGTARAMMNMGLSRLRLVRPQEFDTYRITGIAHRSERILEATEHFDTLEEALADCVWVVGTSARARTEGRNYGRPVDLAEEILARTEAGPVAIVFGREDRGLTNQALDLCHAIAVVPTAVEYSSLNLAQAVMVVAYELFRRTSDAERPLPRGRRATEPASHEDLVEMYRALRGGLAELEFFKARKPESVMRTLRTILSQADLDHREARLIAGIGYEMGHVVRRLRPQESNPPKDGSLAADVGDAP